jgi:hypothetical protein
MRFDYHDLYDHQFEDLVVGVCTFLLGAGIQKFSTGKDGGRDARFRGTATAFPSDREPASGLFVVQAKHTERPWAKLSDADFSNADDDSIVSKEIPRVKQLLAANEVDHYILFTNRRAGGGTTATIEARIREETGLDNVTLYGIESLDQKLKLFPRSVEIADVKDFQGPIRVVPDDLATIILALAEELKKPSSPPARLTLDRVTFEEKNKRNQLSGDVAKKIVTNYFKDFGKVKRFLGMPANRELRELYESTAAEFDAEIIERRSDDVSMDSLLNSLIDRLRHRDSDLSRNVRLTRTVVYYMYWICDLGRAE